MKQSQDRTQQSKWVITLALSILVITSSVVMSAQLHRQNHATESGLKSPKATQGQYTVLLETSKPVIEKNGDETKVTAVVRDSEGNSLPNVAVQFATQLGALSNQSVQTNVDGIASTTLTAGPNSGQAVIQATVGDTIAIAYVEVRDTTIIAIEPVLSIHVGNATLKSGQSTEITIQVNDGSGRLLVNAPVTLFGSLGTVESTSMVTDSSGKAVTNFVASRAGGQATITALSGYTSATTKIQVIGEPIATATPVRTQLQLYLPVVSR